MRWPWQRRRTAAVPAARHAMPRQSWAQPAFPPVTAAPTVAPQVAPIPPTEPALPVAVPVQASAVLLGFADGSQVALDERDPSALALRAVAELLVQDRPH